eukprot:7761341-Heterocapsa_arctica.AAC.1
MPNGFANLGIICAKSVCASAQIAELQDLTPGMLGTRSSHAGSFSPKGAEARWMLLFVNEMLVTHRAMLPVVAADALIDA